MAKNLRSHTLSTDDAQKRLQSFPAPAWGDHVLGGVRARTVATNATPTYAAQKRRASKRSRA